jgi:hypothetical protein
VLWSHLNECSKPGNVCISGETITFGQYLMLVCETGLEVYGIYASRGIKL